MQLSRPRAGHLSWATWGSGAAVRHRRPRGHATLPAPGGDDELHEWFADFLSHRLDGRRPLWESVLLDGLAGGRWALVTKTHHCLVDGMGSVDVGRILLDGERSPRRRVRCSLAHRAPGRRAHSPLAAVQHLLVKGAKAGR